MACLRVRETIRHGDYHNMRELTITPTWEGFVSLLSSSPYAAGDSSDTLAGNRFAAVTFADLIRTGCARRDWATYEVIK